jgi:hypothetical protein
MSANPATRVWYLRAKYHSATRCQEFFMLKRRKYFIDKM